MVPEFFQYRRERFKVSKKVTELVIRGKIQNAAEASELTRYQPSIEPFNMNSPKRGLCPLRMHPLVKPQQHPDPEIRKLELTSNPGRQLQS